MSAKHTPGPWLISLKDRFRIVNTRGNTIADCGTSLFMSEEENAANVALCLAAPDMLEALKYILPLLNRQTVEFNMTQDAILKAEPQP